MDLGPPRHYVAPAMEFLLILSAVLSAVTGAVTGARAPEVRLHQEARAQTVVAALPSARVAAPAARIETAVQAVAPVPAHALPVFAVPAAVPLYADRPIE